MDDGKQQQSQAKEEVNDYEGDVPEEVTCDWIVCEPPCCQKLSIPACLLLWLCLCSFTQGMLVNGFVNSVLTSLERRFDLSSTESGLIASSYDIGSVLCLIPVTYFGRRYRRSRLIAVGVLIMGIGSFVFTIPHFSTGSYTYQSPVAPLCYLTPGIFPNFCSNQQQLNNYKWVFWFGQFLHGLGATPLYTLGVAYLDDNLSSKHSGAFLGIYYAMSVIGPAMGYLLGGVFLEYYVELGYTPKDLSPSNTSIWVGAWWLGFLLTGTLSLLIVIPMFGFPKSFRGSKKLMKERRQEAHGSSIEQAAELKMGLKDFLPSVKVILSNPTFVFLSLAGAVDTLLVTGLSTFGPKMLQTLFYMTASSSTFSIGLVSVPCGALGLLLGGLVIRFFDLNVQKLLWLCCASSSIGLVLGLGFLIRCSPQSFAGVNTQYNVLPFQANNLTAGCNTNCNCEANKFLFSPVCGADAVTYYSPCFAGCSSNGSLIDGKTYYENCSCIASNVTVNNVGYSAFSGSCVDANCNSVPIILALIGLFMFFLFFISIPTLQSTIRVIPPIVKDFGLGIQWIFLRCLGSIPGPLLLGRFIDVTCSLWTGGCGSTGSCSLYDGYWFWVLILLFVFIVKAIETTFLFLAAIFYKAPPQKSKDQEIVQQQHQQQQQMNEFDNGGFENKIDE